MICGLDESGRGPCFGPLVVAGVLVERDDDLFRIGVKDSKQLSAKKREHLAPQIKRYVKKYEIRILSATDIDDLRKTMTLNQLEVFIFSNIIEKLKPTVCYVDAADVNAARFGREISVRLTTKSKIISEHKADNKYPVVAAASILAKTTRDEQVRKLAKDLEKKLGIPLGSGYPADPVTKQFLTTWVNTYGDLPPHVRRSWETAQQIMKKYKNKTLDEF